MSESKKKAIYKIDAAGRGAAKAVDKRDGGGFSGPPLKATPERSDV